MDSSSQERIILLKSFYEKYLSLLPDDKIACSSTKIDQNSIFILNIENKKAFLKNIKNKKYISINQDGQIYFNSQISNSAKLDLSFINLNKCTLKSNCGKYLSSSEDGNIIANKNNISNNEIFTIIYLKNNINNYLLNPNSNKKQYKEIKVNENLIKNINLNISDNQNKIKITEDKDADSRSLIIVENSIQRNDLNNTLKNQNFNKKINNNNFNVFQNENQKKNYMSQQKEVQCINNYINNPIIEGNNNYNNKNINNQNFKNNLKQIEIIQNNNEKIINNLNYSNNNNNQNLQQKRKTQNDFNNKLVLNNNQMININSQQHENAQNGYNNKLDFNKEVKINNRINNINEINSQLFTINKDMQQNKNLTKFDSSQNKYIYLCNNQSNFQAYQNKNNLYSNFTMKSNKTQLNTKQNNRNMEYLPPTKNQANANLNVKNSSYRGEVGIGNENGNKGNNCFGKLKGGICCGRNWVSISWKFIGGGMILGFIIAFAVEDIIDSKKRKIADLTQMEKYLQLKIVKKILLIIVQMLILKISLKIKII